VKRIGEETVVVETFFDSWHGDESVEF